MTTPQEQVEAELKSPREAAEYFAWIAGKDSQIEDLTRAFKARDEWWDKLVRRLRQECAALTGIENDKLNALAEADKLRAERDALKAEVEKWKREVEMEQEISANPIYCRKCDSCGEEGCCSAKLCLYGGENEKRLEAAESALSEARAERDDWQRRARTAYSEGRAHMHGLYDEVKALCAQEQENAAKARAALSEANKRLAEAKRNFERMRRCAYRYSTKLDAAEAKLRAQETALRKAKAVIDSLDTEEDDDNAIADAKAFVEDALAALPQPQSQDATTEGQ